MTLVGLAVTAGAIAALRNGPRTPSGVSASQPGHAGRAAAREAYALAITARDRETGHGVAGISFLSSDRSAEARTDADGECRLLMTPEAPGRSPPAQERVVVDPRGGPYFGYEMAIPPRRGTTPDRLRVDLTRGIGFRVTVVDRDTGRPIRGLRLVFWPLSPTPAVDDALPPGATYLHSRAVEQAEGTYRGVATPGPGVICVEDDEGRYAPAPGAGEAAIGPDDAADDAVVDPATGPGRLLRIEKGRGRGIHLLPRESFAGLVFINPRPGPEPLEVTLVLRKKAPIKANP